MGKHYHAIEKLTLTVRCLATHPGDARQRLVAAFDHFGHLKPEELPQASRKDFVWVLKNVRKLGPLIDGTGRVWRGSIENTMKSVRKSTASKIAKKLYELYWAVSKNTEFN